MNVLRLLGLLFVVFALAAGIVAQPDTLGLSQADYALFEAANARSAAANTYRFNYNASFVFRGMGLPASEGSLSGMGIIARDDSLDLLISFAGTLIDPEAGNVDINAEMRLVDGALYFNNDADPNAGRTAWRRFDNVLEALFARTTTEVINLNDLDALGSAIFSVLQVRQSDFITASRLADVIENGAQLAHFRANIGLIDLLSLPEFIGALAGDPTMLTASSPEEAQLQSQLLGMFWRQIVPNATITLDQYINPQTSLVERATFSMLLEFDASMLSQDPEQLLSGMSGASSQAEAISFSMQVDISLSDYNAPLRVEAPADFIVEDVAASMDLLMSGEMPLLEPGPQITGPQINVPQVNVPQVNIPQVNVPQGIPPATQAQPIAINEPVVIQLAGAGPIDLLLQADEGTVITVTARSLAEPAIDTTLEVLDANNTRLAFNDDHGTNRADLNVFDSFIGELKLLSSGPYIIRVNSFTGLASGPVEVLVSDATQRSAPAQTNVPGEPSTEIITGAVADNQSFRHDVLLFAGDSVTITVRAMDNLFDPKVMLVDPANIRLADNDDHASADPTLGRYDSRIRDFPIRADGVYSIIIQGFAGTGGSFELTVERWPSEQSAAPAPTSGGQTQGLELTGGGVETIVSSIESFETFRHSLFARAGDVYTITARATSPNFDPQVTLRNADQRALIANDEHGTSDPMLGVLDARIHNYLIESDGTYFIEVTGFRDSAGSFALTIELIAQNAPLSQPIDQVFTGQIGVGEVFTQTFEAQEGDFVTITVRALSQGFDPQVTLISPSGLIIADNDDHGTNASDLGFLDSRIHNHPIIESGTYQVEVTGYRASAGTFAITISTIR